MADPVDVCIVGSGAGGAPVALELARAGLRVVVLDKGPWRHPADHVHDELAVTRRDFFVPFVSDEPHVLRRARDETGDRTNFGWISCCVGGGTVHWAGFAFRMSPDDLRRRTLTGGVAGSSVADWPIAFEELAPFYDRAEAEIGVSGDGPGLLPALAAHPLAGIVERAATQSGLTASVTPKAILSQPHLDRPGCVFCELCASYGCEIGAKGSTADALLPRAIATGRCELRPQAMAREVKLDASGRASSVVYADRNGAVHEQPARAVVLACSAVETARLLLLSRSPRFPNGLANSSGLVGKNFILVGRGGGAADFLYRGRSGIAGLERSAPFIGRAIRNATDAGGTLVFELEPKSPIQMAETLAIGADGSTLWGKALKDRLRRYWREGRHLGFEAFSEALPVEDSTVDLDPTVRDRFGLPVARITLVRHPSDSDRSARLVARGLEVVHAMKPDRVVGSTSGQVYDVLQGGTCRFGTDPARSVLDRDCRAHDVPNLWVTDGSFIPTMGSVPPTLTILANAFRVASRIVAARNG